MSGGWDEPAPELVQPEPTTAQPDTPAPVADWRMERMGEAELAALMERKY